MEVRILSFDTGTANTGWSVLKGSTFPNRHVFLYDFGMVKTNKKFGDVRERIDFIGNEVRKLIRDSLPTHIAMEDFTEQGKFVGKTYKEMAWLTEHFRLIGREFDVPVTIYENGVWKKKTMKASRVNKDQVIHFISHKLPETPEFLKNQPNHVWDSVGIGYCKWLDLLNDRGDLHV